MADKEATVFVIDIASSMGKKRSGYKSSVLDYCLEYVWDKLGIKIMAMRKTDYVAVVAVGSDLTDNAMADEEAYEHVRVILPFPRRDNDEVRSYTFSKSHVDVMTSELHPSSTNEGDLLSGVIIGVQMLTDFCGKLKFTKNLILITDGERITDYTDAEAVANQINTQGIKFSALGVDFDDADIGVKEEDKSEIKINNERSLKRMCEETQDDNELPRFATMAEVISAMENPRIKPVRPVTTFRGILSIGDEEKFGNSIQMAVERYPKTKQAKVPSASKFSTASETKSIIASASQGYRSDQAQSEDIKATHQVVPSRTYKLQDGEELEDRSQLEKGYSYGKTIVPVTKADEDFLQFESKAGLQILGFLDAGAYARYMSMGEASLIVGQKANPGAALALSSLVHALWESDAYAIGRFVRKDNSAPLMVLLAPNIEPDFECLLEVALPFTEDIRQYKFAPLDRVRTSRGDITEQHRYLPSVKLNDAMDSYMDAMDLDTLGERDGIDSDILSPEDTFSYGVHRVMKAIMHRAFHAPSDPIPPPVEAILRGSQVPTEVKASKIFDTSIKNLIDIANVKKVPPRTAYKRRHGEKQEPVKTSIDLDALLGDEVMDDQETDKPAGSGAAGTASIGEAHPAQDFEAMMKNDNLIDAAFAQIQPVLEELVQYSLGNQTYETAIESFKVFRKHAIAQEEVEVFNVFLERFEIKMKDENRSDFLALLKEQKITPITEEEANTSL